MNENRKSIYSYDQRIARVCEFVYQNLDKELTLEQMSEVAAFSKFHFHRVFSAYTGMSATKFLQLARLRRASFRLAFEPQKKIIDIAYEAGFDSPEAFARAFKRTFDQSPTDFRAEPKWPEWHLRFQFQPQPSGEIPMNVTIVNFETTTVALIEHLGPPEKVLETAGKFIAWRKATGLSPVKTSKTFGIPYSDPSNTEPEKFRWDVCGSIDTDVPANDYGVKAGVIPGGKCAVIRHQGSHSTLGTSIYAFYREWLPNSGEEVRDFPCFFHYLNFVHEVDECDLQTDIYFPLR
ncbi:AraC family transcriptional regulator [Cellvibrio sp. KY-GH-1]|uniref:AraC family transcriptional regulator n=1 Tax=Cellvibrio sp. KY-GH-1 TaxID=2303332 RepID=UPI001245B41F|nr:AraC family transcriptional regulator [Cellvibrio sp. KY-GH-1]QEY17126.1 AraC family transcriptional regulator [Cellvibrio sp. KY-GH-1]